MKIIKQGSINTILVEKCDTIIKLEDWVTSSTTTTLTIPSTRNEFTLINNSGGDWTLNTLSELKLNNSYNSVVLLNTEYITLKYNSPNKNFVVLGKSGSDSTSLTTLFNSSMLLTEGTVGIVSNTLDLTTNDKDIVTISTTGAITINTITAPTTYFKKEIIFPLAVTNVTINASLYHSLKGTFTNGVVNKLTIQKLDNSGKYFLTW